MYIMGQRGNELFIGTEEQVWAFTSWADGMTCRTGPKDDGPFRPCLPKARFFCLHGDVSTFTDLEDLNIGLYPENIEMMERFFSDIPRSLRDLTSRDGHRQWALLEAARHTDGFGSFLQQEQRTHGLGYILAVWGLTDYARRPAFERRRIAREMMTYRRRDYLSMLLDIEVPESMVRLLNRAEPAFMRRSYLWELHETLTDPKFKGHVTGLKRLTTQIIPIIRWLPERLRVAAFLDELARQEYALSHLVDIIPDCLLMAPTDFQDAMAKSLKHCQGRLEIVPWVREWKFRLFAKLPFPPPPVPGDDRLTPILTPRDLVQEGRDMSNCVADYYEDVMRGDMYFYHWDDTEPATVQLIHDGDEWFLDDHLGPNNEPLLAETEVEIERLVESQLAQNFRLETYVAGTAYYKAQEEVSKLYETTPLFLLREPNNTHDERAIVVKTMKGVKLGYIPRHQNKKLARLMDIGIPCSCLVTHADRTNRSHAPHISIVVEQVEPWRFDLEKFKAAS